MYGSASTRVAARSPGVTGNLPTGTPCARLVLRGRRSRVEPDLRQAGGLVEAEGDVGRLHRAAGGALGQVVDRADRQHRAGALVEPSGDVGHVAAQSRL